MNFKINSAIIIGRDHELVKKNRQDFVSTYISENEIIGVVCDGCGESLYSEVGASLLGTFIVNYFKMNSELLSKTSIIDIKKSLEICLYNFFYMLQHSMFFYFSKSTDQDRISFIKEFMLSTCLFCFINENKVVIGHCGDGIIIVNDYIDVIDQTGSPHYIAYKNIPKEVLQTDPSTLDFFKIEEYELKDINKIIIGSDGIQPLVDNNLIQQLYGTQKRQLQRKFNLWQQEKLFGDDASCIVIEKNENSSL